MGMGEEGEGENVEEEKRCRQLEEEEKSHGGVWGRLIMSPGHSGGALE